MVCYLIANDLQCFTILGKPKWVNGKINFRSACMLDIFAVKRIIYEQNKYDTIKHGKALQQLAHQVMWSF